ncbi:hypothetical protein AMECASPLE_014508 [Ameca splendens]|uniref:Uncharacterized protein n=1 Tax=Ameca splendens TaxID=208324 RepID=A0ABV0ZXF6_9TELE
MILRVKFVPEWDVGTIPHPIQEDGPILMLHSQPTQEKRSILTEIFQKCFPSSEEVQNSSMCAQQKNRLTTVAVKNKYFHIFLSSFETLKFVLSSDIRFAGRVLPEALCVITEAPAAAEGD